jgi:dienelactone hydrolase
MTTGSTTADALAVDARDCSENTEPIDVQITGAPPNTAVEFTAALQAEDGAEWQSHATFTVDADGTVDLAADSPDAGTWEGAEPMAWLWSMRSQEDVQFPALGGPTYDVELTAETGEDRVSRTITRVRWDDAITARDVDREGVVGTLYEPPGDGPHPAVVDLHGSAGRMGDGTARHLASEGYATLALSYVGEQPSLPDDIDRIPLSTLDDAADWLCDQPAVAAERVGLLGVSRGAELALLLAARRDWVGPVVSYSGSVPWDTPLDVPAWLDDGEPVPHLTAEEAPSLEDLDEKPVADVVPAVENADGPILLVSGGKDPVWDARRLSEAVADRLRDHDFPHEFTHLTYDDVGHFIGRPYQPLGELGDFYRQRATAHAGEDSWPVVLEYLENGLKQEKSQ